MMIPVHFDSSAGAQIIVKIERLAGQHEYLKLNPFLIRGSCLEVGAPLNLTDEGALIKFPLGLTSTTGNTQLWIKRKHLLASI